MKVLKENAKWIGLGGCVLMIIGCFLPFATVSALGLSQSVNYIDGDGVFVVIAAVVAAILIYLKKGKLILIPSLISAAFVIYDAASGSSAASSSLANVSFGIGFFLIVIGIICVSAYPFLDNEKK